MDQCVTASIVLFRHPEAEVRDLFESLSRESMLSSWSVVNNGGADPACRVAASLGGLCIHPGRNVGFGAGNNLALKALMPLGTYHLFINPDISFAAGVIHSLFRFMERHQDVGLVMPRILYPDGSEQRLCKLLPTPFDLFLRRFLGAFGKFAFRSQWDAYEMRGTDMSVAREVPSLSGCFMFVRTAALQEVGLFDERYFLYMEDFDLCRRIGCRYRTVFYPEVSVSHRFARGSYDNVYMLGHHLNSAIRYFNKWGWFHDPERELLNVRTSPIQD